MKKKFISLQLMGFLGISLSLYSMEKESNKGIQLMLLNGPMCAGKSSLAEALVKEAHAQGFYNFTRMSFDSYVVEVSKNRDYTQEQIRYFKKKGVTIFADPSLSGTQQEIQQDFVIFYHQILEKMNEGAVVIADHCFMNRESFLDFLATFKKHYSALLLIKVFCTYEVAKDRLNRRNASGNSEQYRCESSFDQHYSAHNGLKEVVEDHKIYDREIDTSNVSLEHAARDLFSMFVNQVPTNADNACMINKKKYASALYKRYYGGECLLS